MGLAEDLVGRGLFPRELPPVFKSCNFARFSSSSSFIGTSHKVPIAELGTHSLARTGSLRRPLGIPNPIAQLLLAKQIEKHWSQVQLSWADTTLSLTKPTPCSSPSERAFEPFGRLGMKPHRRLGERAGRKKLVKADVSSFYHSIYTHSIPWALHTKKIAKSDRSARLYGNEIDTRLRNTQHGQTVGIPIGPDTSLIISELVLSAVDRGICKEFPKISGFRYIDDYEFTCDSEQEAQDILGTLEQHLAEYELRLNHLKTSIKELPQPLFSTWLSELRDFSLESNNSRTELLALMAFFDRAVVLRERHPRDHIFRYALGRLCKNEPSSENLDAYQKILISASASEPGCLPRVLAKLQDLRIRSIPINQELLEFHLNEVITHHSPKGHNNEVAWAIFGCLLFDIKISSSARIQLERSSDDYVALLALQADYCNLVDGALATDNWEQHLKEEELWGSHWLLAYEAVASRLLVPGGDDYLDKYPSFKKAHDASIRFFDEVDENAPIEISVPGLHELDIGIAHSTAD